MLQRCEDVAHHKEICQRILPLRVIVIGSFDLLILFKILGKQTTDLESCLASLDHLFMMFLLFLVILDPSSETVGKQSIIKVAFGDCTSVSPLLTLLAALMPEDQSVLRQANLLVQLHLEPHLVHQASSL